MAPHTIGNELAPRGRRVGIKQVAEHLGLSTCTVSRILNDKMGEAKYKRETIERVRRAGKELGCQPDLVARALVQGKTWMIGLCLADIANETFGAFASEFERRAAGDGFATFICNSREDPVVEKHYVETLLARRVDALVISPIHASSEMLIKSALRKGCRVILFDRDIDAPGVGSVQTDNCGGMAELTRRCLALGHQRIGVLVGNPRDSSLQLRLAGINDAVRESGLDPVIAVTVAADCNEMSREAGQRGFAELMRCPSRPSLVLALGNALTLGALSQARKLGIQIGKEVSLAGFDDFAGAEFVTPAITVVAQPIREMALRCAEMAAGEAGSSLQKIVLPPRICWRESVKQFAEKGDIKC